MSEQAGVRLGQMAHARRLAEQARAAELLRDEELARVQAEANLGYLRGMLGRLVAGFNRTCAPDDAVTLKVEDRRISIMQSYTALLILSFEADAVSVETAPPHPVRKRFRFAPAAAGATTLVDETRPDAIPGLAESFCESVLMLALGLHA